MSLLPYPGGLTATANGLLVFSAGFAVVYAAMLQWPPSWRRTVAKVLSIILLLLVAIDREGPVLLAVAIALSAAGDAFLAQEGERPFLGGLVSFLLAHLVYVALFVTADSGPPLPAAGGTAAVAAIAAFVALVGWLVVPAVSRSMKLPVVAYMAAIFAMGITAALSANPVVLLGAVLFIASDAALGAGRFVLAADHRLQRPVQLFVWIAYWLAQATILVGMTA